MNTAEIIEAATAEGLVVDLSPSGSIKAIGEQEVVNRWRPILRQHKAEIISLLSGNRGRAVQATWKPLPSWCSTLCEHYHRLEVPEVGTILWCCHEVDDRHWQRDRIDKMYSCPKNKSNTVKLK